MASHSYAKTCLKEYGIRNETLLQVENEQELPQAIEKAQSIDPRKVRDFWESSELRSDGMASKYMALYQEVLDGATW